MIMIHNIQDLAAEVGTDEAGIKKALYKATECGIIFNEKDSNTVSVCGYAEGADAECMEHDLVYPFSADDFWFAVQQADDEGCEMWHEWNDDPEEVDNIKVESDAMDSFGNFPDAGDSASYKR